MITEKTENQFIDVQERIISKISEFILVEKEQEHFVSTILGISSKSAYRRLAGVTKFSLSEAAKIASHLGFSLDSLIGHLPKQNALFELDNVNAVSSDLCKAKMEQYRQIFCQGQDITKTEYVLATNNIPIGICVKSRLIYKFTLFKWLYWTGRVNPNFKLSELSISDELLAMQKQYSEAYSSCLKGTLIFDDFLFHSIVAEIQFFYARGLVTQEDKELLSKELYESIDALESAATNGYYKDDIVSLDMYISELKIDTTYLYIMSDKQPASYFAGYSINLFKTTDADIFAIQEQWLKSLKRYSSSITKSNEMYRYAFFDKQRSIVDTLTNDSNLPD